MFNRRGFPTAWMRVGVGLWTAAGGGPCHYGPPPLYLPLILARIFRLARTAALVLARRGLRMSWNGAIENVTNTRALCVWMDGYTCRYVDKNGALCPLDVVIVIVSQRV